MNSISFAGSDRPGRSEGHLLTAPSTSSRSLFSCLTPWLAGK